jgi:hypothetical protein
MIQGEKIMSENLTQIRHIVANYSRLQGLRSVPVGMFVAAAGIWVNLPVGQDGDLGPLLVMIVIASLAYFLIDRYYARTFGQVKPTGKGRSREIFISVVWGALAFSAFLFDTADILPISAFGLVFAAVLFIEFSRSFGKLSFQNTPEAFLAPMLVGVAALLPALGIFWWQALGMQFSLSALLVLTGILMAISGIIGHLRFTRLLAEVRETDNA